MRCNLYPAGTLGRYKYVVTIARYQEGILLSRHKERLTWECQGGHVEEGETAEQAARRELYEESGAAEYTIEPLCDYTVDGDDNAGAAFVACVRSLRPLPEDFEMAEVRVFDALPEQLTYPHILPTLYECARQKGMME